MIKSGDFFWKTTNPEKKGNVTGNLCNSHENHLKSLRSRHLNFAQRKKASKKDDNMEVTIKTGLKRFDDEDLKTVRGKRPPVAVPANATGAAILEKAVAKWKAFDRRFEATKECALAYHRL